MFFEFRQNNSGGSFVANHEKGISHFVIVEANDTDDADRRAEQIGLYFNGCQGGKDCSCCGDRWVPSYGKGTRTPSLYDKTVKPGSVFKNSDMPGKWIKDGPEGYIHYLNGDIKGFWLVPSVKKTAKKTRKGK